MEDQRTLTVEKEKSERTSPKKNLRSPYESPKKGPTLSTSTSSFEVGKFLDIIPTLRL